MGRERHSVQRNLRRRPEDIQYPSCKICSLCQITKPSVEFHKQKSSLDGLKSSCKFCAKIARHEWYLKNAAREIAKTAAYQAANSEKKSQYAKTSYYRNHEPRKARNRAAYEANSEKINKAFKEKYRQDESFRLSIQEKVRKRYEADPEKVKAYQQRHRRENPEKHQVWSNNRRTRVKSADGVCTSEQWLQILQLYAYCCAYCLKHESVAGKMTVEHMTPISRGGSNDPDNLVPACRSCNCSKNSKTLLEFLSFRNRLAA